MKSIAFVCTMEYDIFTNKNKWHKSRFMTNPQSMKHKEFIIEKSDYRRKKKRTLKNNYNDNFGLYLICCGF